MKAAWAKNAGSGLKPKAGETEVIGNHSATTVVHLIRKPRPHQHGNRTTNHTQGVKNVSNVSSIPVEKPDPALNGLDHIAQKVAHFGEELEKFSKAQAGKGKKGQKLPPQVAKIMENAEDLMRKIIAVADDKVMEVPKVDTKANKTSNQSFSIASSIDENSLPQRKSATNAAVTPMNSTMDSNATSKNASANLQSSNKTDKVATPVVVKDEASAAAVSKNKTLMSNITDKNVTMKAIQNATAEATSSNENQTSSVRKNTATPRNAGSKRDQYNFFWKQPAASTTTTSTTREPLTMHNATRMVHSTLGAARLAAAKLRGMRANLHKSHVEDDSWKLANAEIDSRIEGLKAAREDAMKADDKDLAESLQEKINGLQAEENENKAKAEKLKAKQNQF